MTAHAQHTDSKLLQSVQVVEDITASSSTAVFAYANTLASALTSGALSVSTYQCKNRIQTLLPTLSPALCESCTHPDFCAEALDAVMSAMQHADPPFAACHCLWVRSPFALAPHEAVLQLQIIVAHAYMCPPASASGQGCISDSHRHHIHH